MCFSIAALIAISLLSRQVCGQVDCSTEDFISPPPTCVGDQLVFNCSVNDTSAFTDGNTVWTVNPSSASAPSCILDHGDWPMSPSRVCGSFQAQTSGESPEHCFISTLNTTASLSLDGVEVACSFALGLTEVDARRGTIRIAGPVETTNISCGPIRDGSSPNTRNLTISWTTVEDYQISRYVVSVLPLEQSGTEMVHEVRSESSEFTNKQLEVEVEVGSEYNITVRADNCGDQQEGNTLTEDVFQDVPLRPKVVAVRRVSRKESGDVTLCALDITVDITEPTVSCAVGPIETLTISFNPPALGSPVIISRANDMYCRTSAQRCSYTHVFRSDCPVSQFDVEVTASNVAGESIVATRTIDSLIVGVEVNSIEDPRSVTVTLSEGLNVSESCSFKFGNDSTYMTLPREGVNGTINDTGVTFSLGILLDDTEYYYNMSCEADSNTTSVIQGSFRSSCSGEDLVESATSNCEGPVGYLCLVVEDGAAEVVYDDTVAMHRLVSSSHCMDGNSTRRCMSDGIWDGMAPSFPRDKKLESWQIALVVIGVVTFLIGSCVCSVLGTMLVLHATTKTGGIIAIVMLVVSVITFPVSIITYCVVKKTEGDVREVKLRPFYKFMLVAASVITVVIVICWIVLIVYVASNDFCDDPQRVGRTVLVVICFLLSLLVALEWCVSAVLWRWGTTDSSATEEGTDSGKPPAKPKRSKKSKQKEAEEEQGLQMYDTLQHGKTSSSPTPLIDPNDPTYGHLQQKKGEGGDQADEYSHIQRGGKPKAVPNPEDPNYSHFKQEGGGGGEEYSQLNRGKGVSTLPGAVPAPSDPSYGKLKKEEEEPSEYDVVTNEPRHKPRKRDK